MGHAATKSDEVNILMSLGHQARFSLWLYQNEGSQPF